MPKQGGQGKGKPKLADRSFGKALIKRQQQGAFNERKKSTNMASILDSTTLDDFIIHNEMEEEEIEVRRVHNNDSFLVDSSSNRNKIQSYTTKEFQFNHLCIPRKPEWNKDMTAEEVDRREKNSFLQWRRNIAALEEESARETNSRVTPFEKNLEVWRQLWRVVERSDFLVQIVDARNPLLYYTEDLSAYANSKNRKMMLLVNKADLLTDNQRISWSRYFKDIGVRCVFYSAKTEQTKLDSADDSSSQTSVDVDEVNALANFLVNGWDSQELPNYEERITVGNLKEEEDDGQDGDEDIVWGAPESELEGIEEEDEQEGEQEDETADEVDTDKNEVAVGRSYNILREEADDAGRESEDEEEVLNKIDEIQEVVDSKSGNNNNENSDESEDESDDESEGIDEVEGEQVEAKAAEVAKEIISKKQSPPVGEVSEQSFNLSAGERTRARVLNRLEIVLLLTSVTDRLKISPQDRNNGRVCVGMVGYPNVGKSSVINTILGVSKATHGVVRVAVSATPGKTKHFQTLVVSDSLLLCDCPGLVFPSFMRSVGEMLCAGILPYNQMRDYVEPAAVMAARVPMHLLEAAYGMKIQRILDVKDDPNRPPTAHEMLCAYCAVKGYITNGTGRWDEFRACKDMLRDFTDGRILYVAMPPSLQQEASEQTLRKWVAETEKVMLRNEKISDRVAVQKLKNIESCEDGSVGGEMVFGGLINREKKASSAAPLPSSVVVGEFEYVMDDSESENGDDKEGEEDDGGRASSVAPSTAASSRRLLQQGGGAGDDLLEKREHKRLKHWGKKNKKLRDKNPYGEDNGVVSYVAYSTNRTGVFGGVESVKRDKIRRQDPRHAYGSTFIRPALPHQQQPVDLTQRATARA